MQTTERIIPASELIVNADGSVFHLHLKPHEAADTVILVGDPARVERVAAHFDAREAAAANREFVSVTGAFRGRRMTVVSTGIGTDNIDIVLTELDALVNVDFATRTVRPEPKSLTIMRLGTCGALQPELRIGDLVFSRASVGMDGLLDFYAGRDAVCDLAMERALKRHMGWGSAGREAASGGERSEPRGPEARTGCDGYVREREVLARPRAGEGAGVRLVSGENVSTRANFPVRASLATVKAASRACGGSGTLDLLCKSDCGRKAAAISASLFEAGAPPDTTRVGAQCGPEARGPASRAHEAACGGPPIYCVHASDELAAHFADATVTGITVSAPGFYGPQGRWVRLRPADERLTEKLESFAHDGMKILNLEMESSAVAGLARLMGHRAATLCTVIAQRTAGASDPDYAPFVDRMIKTALDKLAAL